MAEAEADPDLDAAIRLADSACTGAGRLWRS